MKYQLFFQVGDDLLVMFPVIFDVLILALVHSLCQNTGGDDESVQLVCEEVRRNLQLCEHVEYQLLTMDVDCVAQLLAWANLYCYDYHLVGKEGTNVGFHLRNIHH